MDISAMLEDLEVEGYFASNPSSAEKPRPKFYQRVRVISKFLPVTDLVLPLQGKDFLAGFETKGTNSRWLVLLHYGYLELENHEAQFQHIGLKFSALVQSHLKHSLIRITIIDELQELAGYILKVDRNSIVLFTTSGQMLHIPNRSIILLAVEKISIKDKLSAT
jgi:hypothetical protein